MFNKLVIALAILSLGGCYITPGGVQPREYNYHKRLNRNFDNPQCNRNKPYLIRDAYTGRLKCVSRQKYERW